MRYDNLEHITTIASTFNECRVHTESVCRMGHTFSSINAVNSVVLVNGLGNINILTNLTANSCIALPMISAISASQQFDAIQQNIVNDFFMHVNKLVDEGKLQESIKESYKAFDKILEFKNIDLADRILSFEAMDNLPNPLLISFLNSTSKFKRNLKSRNLIFEKLKNNVTEQIGEENFNKSLYVRLK